MNVNEQKTEGESATKRGTFKRPMYVQNTYMGSSKAMNVSMENESNNVTDQGRERAPGGEPDRSGGNSNHPEVASIHSLDTNMLSKYSKTTNPDGHKLNPIPSKRLLNQ